MARRYETTLMINEENEATVSFSVAWGSPESGRFGKPEDYDPGSPDTVEDVRIESIDGHPVEPWEAKFRAADIMGDEDKEDQLLAYAREVEADEAERLARLNPGKKFIVLRATHKLSVSSPESATGCAASARPVAISEAA